MIGALDPQTWWWLSRASGMVAGILLVLSVIWGVLLATRALRAIDRPAWLLAIHRWFSALTCVGVAVHVAALVADNYVHFGWSEVLVPWGSPHWKNTPVALGVIAMYLLIAVEASSLAMHRIPKRWWRMIHLTSYAAVWLGLIHGALAGTDASSRPYVLVALALVIAVVSATLVRVSIGTARQQRAAAPPTGARTTAPRPVESRSSSAG